MNVAMFVFHANVSTNVKYLRNDKSRGKAENGCESVLFLVDVLVISCGHVYVRLQSDIKSSHHSVTLWILTTAKRNLDCYTLSAHCVLVRDRV